VDECKPLVAGYLYDQFDLDLVTAGIIASCYGLMNLFARSIGGIVSDKMSVKFGMRGKAVQVDSINTRVESALLSALEATDCIKTYVESAYGLSA